MSASPQHRAARRASGALASLPAPAAVPWAAASSVTTCSCGHAVRVHQDGSDPRAAGACRHYALAPRVTLGGAPVPVPVVRPGRGWWWVVSMDDFAWLDASQGGRRVMAVRRWRLGVYRVLDGDGRTVAWSLGEARAWRLVHAVGDVTTAVRGGRARGALPPQGGDRPPVRLVPPPATRLTARPGGGAS